MLKIFLFLTIVCISHAFIRIPSITHIIKSSKSMESIIVPIGGGGSLHGLSLLLESVVPHVFKETFTSLSYIIEPFTQATQLAQHIPLKNILSVVEKVGSVLVIADTGMKVYTDIYNEDQIAAIIHTGAGVAKVYVVPIVVGECASFAGTVLLPSGPFAIVGSVVAGGVCGVVTNEIIDWSAEGLIRISNSYYLPSSSLAPSAAPSRSPAPSSSSSRSSYPSPSSSSSPSSSRSSSPSSSLGGSLGGSSGGSSGGSPGGDPPLRRLYSDNEMKDELEANWNRMSGRIRDHLNNDFPGNNFSIVVNNGHRVRRNGHNYINIYTDNTRTTEIAHFTSHQGSARASRLPGSSIHFRRGVGGDQITLNLIGTYPHYTDLRWNMPPGIAFTPIEQSIADAIKKEIIAILAYDCNIFKL